MDYDDFDDEAADDFAEDWDDYTSPVCGCSIIAISIMTFNFKLCFTIPRYDGIFHLFPTFSNDQ